MKPNMADYEDRYRLALLAPLTFPLLTHDAVCARGWCFCESSVSNLVKDFDFVLDLAKFDESVTRLGDVIKGCAAKRAPPLAPPVFKEDLSTKTFTSPKADLETVGNLYEKEFDEKLREATDLIYEPAVDGRGRGKAVRGDRDRQAGEARGTLPRQQPDWRRRRCRARGGGGQAAAAQGAQPHHSQIGDAGVAALAEVVGKLPQLK